MAVAISTKEYAQAIKLRKSGVKWEEIKTTMGKGTSFVMEMRRRMRDSDPSMVSSTGQASPNYGNGPKAAKKASPLRKVSTKKSTAKTVAKSTAKSTAKPVTAKKSTAKKASPLRKVSTKKSTAKKVSAKVTAESV